MAGNSFPLAATTWNSPSHRELGGAGRTSDKGITLLLHGRCRGIYAVRNLTEGSSCFGTVKVPRTLPVINPPSSNKVALSVQFPPLGVISCNTKTPRILFDQISKAPSGTSTLIHKINHHNYIFYLVILNPYPPPYFRDIMHKFFLNSFSGFFFFFLYFIDQGKLLKEGNNYKVVNLPSNTIKNNLNIKIKPSYIDYHIIYKRMRILVHSSPFKGESHNIRRKTIFSKKKQLAI